MQDDPELEQEGRAARLARDRALTMSERLERVAALSAAMARLQRPIPTPTE